MNLKMQSYGLTPTMQGQLTFILTAVACILTLCAVYQFGNSIMSYCCTLPLAYLTLAFRRLGTICDSKCRKWYRKMQSRQANSRLYSELSSPRAWSIGRTFENIDDG
eukprot:gnl/MRDRNA2_/MRDRNA2_295978_c0_seq1.p2 gnl/MRDRNA2_/MRDRNA2_295978_c0~~gnl/MRDRNA2_/MRDRNA2_295978_c0_seq1.p2  ORF type:complete len:107 (-),score=7.93 gnl/MRDRNA2_/MRDRNA2_295978_c0_seq1:198-518(-)